MCTGRLRARVSTAVPVKIGYVTHRRLAFHKRGVDGSAKADAVYTGQASDCVWGVVYCLNPEDKALLDDHEVGYDEQQVTVIAQSGVLSAVTYVARAEAIDASLRPFSWYHRLVIQGAVQHRLPLDYVSHLQNVELIGDSDRGRHHRNSHLIRRS